MPGPGSARVLHDPTLALAARWPRLVGWTVLLLGLAVLAGWFLQVQALKAPVPGLPSMKANTALSFVAVGTSLLLFRGPGRVRTVSKAAAALAATIGVLTLLEYATGTGLGIDEWLVRDDLSAVATAAPGRMSALAAISFVLVGAGLLLAHARRGALVREACGAGVLFAATFVLGSYAYGAELVSSYTQVAPHTAFAFLLLGPAMLFLRPDGFVATLLLAPDIDGQLARRLFPAALAIPLTLGWIRIELQHLGLVTTATGAALFAATMVLVLVGASALALARLQGALARGDAAEAARQAAQEALVESARRMDEAERVTGRGSWQWDVSTDRAVWSDGMYRLFGLDPATFDNSNENFLAMVHPDDRDRMGAAIGAALVAPGPFQQEYRLTRPDGRLIHVRGEGKVSAGPDGKATVLYGVVVDVTATRAAEEERHRLEQRVAESETRLRTIFANSPVGIIMTRLDGTVADLNPAAEKLWGRKRSDFLDPAFRMDQLYATPSERQRLVERLQKEGGGKDVEVRMRRGDGLVRRMNFSVVVTMVAGEKVFLASGIDVTDLRENEERFRLLFESNPVAVVLSRADGSGFVDVNPAYERLIGYSRAELVDPAFDPKLVSGNPEGRAQLIASLRASGGADALEIDVRRKDGALRTVVASVRPLELGGTASFLTAMQDVTDQRLAELEVRRAQDRFQRIFEASPVAIGLTRDDGRVVDANPAFERLTGYSRAELLAAGFTVRTLYEDPTDRDRVIAALRSVGVVRDTELGLRRKDGQVRSVLISLEFVDLGGKTTILSLFQDITERKRLQAEHEGRIVMEAELERLRRTDEFRAEFINSTAHELRTPMTPLLFSLGTLRLRLGADSPVSREIGTMERAAERLRHVINDMVSAADLQARAIALDRQRLDLTRQLKAAVAGHLEAAHRANLTLEGPPETDLAVLADEHRLQLIMGHLLGNAIKFTPAGGAIRVSARRDGEHARIEVADTGIGLTARQIEGLWKPYSQAHDKSQKTDSGSGLGLYVVKGIVDLHKGEVGVSSPGPGKGSTFWFSLPVPPGS